MSDVVVYRVGLCFASVCVPEAMTLDEVEWATNTQHPTGIPSRWKVSDEPRFANGPANPCPCERFPGRVHRLLNC